VTLVTFGALVQRSIVAARQVALDGIDTEILDLRTLSPYDWESIAASVRKTGRVIVAHEDARSWGYGAEIAARIGSELFEHLDAPVRRVAAIDTFVGYNPRLEDAILPQTADVAAAIRDLAGY
jgi:2-oxoisovalerate dehydrogenase E1 component